MPNADEIQDIHFGEAPLMAKLRKPDILIIGTGRSGTSKTAEILHKHFGVCFGHSPSMLKDFRGETVYEDTGLKKMMRRLIDGDVTIESWLRKFDSTHKGCKAKLTGAKLLGFACLNIEQFAAINPKLIIRTKRPYQSCVDSWVRYRKDGIPPPAENRAWAEEYVKEKEALLHIITPQLKAFGIEVLELFFDPEQECKTDEELIAVIGEVMAACR